MTDTPPRPRLRLRRARCRHRRLGDRAGAGRIRPHRGARRGAGRRRRRAPARRTRRSCTPDSTPSRARSNPAWCAAATPALRLRAADRHPRRTHRGACWSPGTTRNSPRCRACATRPPTTATPHCEIVDADEVYRQVPALGDGALGGLTVPDESIICTWTTNLALATDAVARGVTLRTRHPRRVGRPSRPTARSCTRPSGDISARWVVNAAGLGADYIDRSSATTDSTSPRGAANCSSTTSSRAPLIDKIVLPVPTSRGKGVLVSPTDLRQRHARAHRRGPRPTAPRPATSEAGFEFLLGKGAHADAAPARGGGHRHVRRAARRHRPRRLPHRGRPDQRYVLVGGIRSTGLTSGMAVAEYVGELLDQGRRSRRRTRPNCPRRRGCRTSARRSPRPYQDAELHRRRPGIRQGRLLLRAGHRGRDPRRLPVADPPGRTRRAPSPHPRDERPLPGLLLRRRGRPLVEAHRCPRRRRSDRDPEGSRPMSAPTPHAP